jgi:hypothetical protein
MHLAGEHKTKDARLAFVDSKATKKYATEGAAVDLVLHFDLRLGTVPTVERLAQKHAARLDSLITTGPFRRVWVFDETTRAVVWPLKSTS